MAKKSAKSSKKKALASFTRQKAWTWLIGLGPLMGLAGLTALASFGELPDTDTLANPKTESVLIRRHSRPQPIRAQEVSAGWGCPICPLLHAWVAAMIAPAQVHYAGNYHYRRGPAGQPTAGSVM